MFVLYSHKYKDQTFHVVWLEFTGCEGRISRGGRGDGVRRVGGTIEMQLGLELPGLHGGSGAGKVQKDSSCGENSELHFFR